MSVSSEIIPFSLLSPKQQITLDQQKHSIIFQEEIFCLNFKQFTISK